jgi:hypothetical protein
MDNKTLVEILQEALREGTDYIVNSPPGQVIGTIGDFGNNLINLKYFNPDKKSDKYFHAKANFEATARGKYGERTAEILSDLKEWYDQELKRFPPEDSIEDQKANLYGRSQYRKYPHLDSDSGVKDVDKLFLKH